MLNRKYKGGKFNISKIIKQSSNFVGKQTSKIQGLANQGLKSVEQKNSSSHSENNPSLLNQAKQFVQEHGQKILNSSNNSKGHKNLNQPINSSTRVTEKSINSNSSTEKKITINPINFISKLTKNQNIDTLNKVEESSNNTNIINTKITSLISNKKFKNFTIDELINLKFLLLRNEELKITKEVRTLDNIIKMINNRINELENNK